MGRRISLLAMVGIVSLSLVAGRATTPADAAGPPREATMVFGKTLGHRPPTDRSPSCDNPPESFCPGHDASAHAADSITPRTVVISAGGTVTFDLSGVHGVGVLPAGATLEDVAAGSTGFAGCPGGPRSANYITQGLLFEGAPPCSGAGDATFTFDEPGRYLVICTFEPHLREGDMYGWVIVQ
jgi:plastocyanin